jgi:cold shock CspA family protein
MRFEGTVKSWNEDRAFGFIEPDKGGQDIFLHITALPERGAAPP